MKKFITLLLLFTILILPVYSEENQKKESTFDFYTELAKPTEKYTEEGAVDNSEEQKYFIELDKAYWDKVHKGQIEISKSTYAYYVDYPLLKFMYEGIRMDPNSL